jgi:hypothetical protein
MTNKLNSVLARWLDQGDLDLAASKLNCDLCSKAGRAGLSGTERARWQLYKCCTFQPFVANFLLGAHLASGGQLPVPRGPESGFHLTPLGLFASQDFKRRHQATADEERGADLLCAFYRDGKCGIFAFRPGECSTYFCTGPDQLLSEQSFAVEVAVAQLALFEQGFSEAQVGQQIDLLNEPEREIQTLAMVDLEALYRRAWSYASTLRRKDVEDAMEDV